MKPTIQFSVPIVAISKDRCGASCPQFRANGYDPGGYCVHFEESLGPRLEAPISWARLRSCERAEARVVDDFTLRKLR